MMQIGIWMLCVYMVLKGKELEHIAAASTHEDRQVNLDNAQQWKAVAYIAAVLFFLISIVHGIAMPAL
jgi:hypothetical protein